VGGCCCFVDRGRPNRWCWNSTIKSGLPGPMLEISAKMDHRHQLLHSLGPGQNTRRQVLAEFGGPGSPWEYGGEFGE